LATGSPGQSKRGGLRVCASFEGKRKTKLLGEIGTIKRFRRSDHAQEELGGEFFG